MAADPGVVEVVRGTSPVILGLPHTGTHVPGSVRAQLNATGLALTDTDWHVHELYAGLLPGASTVRATFHRTVIDANRDPSGRSLYPGQATTGLVPLTDFDGAPLWIEGMEPDRADVADRLGRFHRPYHAALAAEVELVRAEHGVAVLYDCHSIRSVCPYLFEGRLPDLNLGTDGGRTCSALIERGVAALCEAADYTFVLNGRFRGGWTTRAYGHPEAGVHAIQMELAQATHLKAEAAPFELDGAKAARLRSVLQGVLEEVERLALDLGRSGARQT